MESPGRYPHQMRPGPLRRALVRAAWILAAAALIWGLYSLPYDILRTERIRAYGEEETQGVVLDRIESADKDGRPLFLVRYAFQDDSGLTRQAEAPFPEDFYRTLRPGDPLRIFYARANPAVVRAQGQLEPWFQAHLRRFLQR